MVSLFIMMLMIGCSGQQRLIIDRCECKCKEGYFYCDRHWKAKEHELTIDNISIPQN
jgi:hypothetical protein